MWNRKGRRIAVNSHSDSDLIRNACLLYGSYVWERKGYLCRYLDGCPYCMQVMYGKGRVRYLYRHINGSLTINLKFFSTLSTASSLPIYYLSEGFKACWLSFLLLFLANGGRSLFGGGGGGGVGAVSVQLVLFAA